MCTCSAVYEILNFLQDKSQGEITDEEILESVIKTLQDSRFETKEKIGFLMEQLSLVYKKTKARRYSSSLLAITTLLQSISPACYKQLYNDVFLTVPTANYLKRLSSAIDMDLLELSDSSLAYLKARYDKLGEKDRLVSILMDEVYSHQTVEREVRRIREWPAYENTALCHV